jgi:hypothetical protein
LPGDNHFPPKSAEVNASADASTFSIHFRSVGLNPIFNNVANPA